MSVGSMLASFGDGWAEGLPDFPDVEPFGRAGLLDPTRAGIEAGRAAGVQGEEHESCWP